METAENACDRAQWTLADFLCTYRFWALFLAWLLVGLAAQGFFIMIPAIASIAGLSATETSMYYSGSAMGWFGAAFIAFVVAGRAGRAALIWPLAICVLAVGTFMTAQSLWGSPVFLFLLGFPIGTAQAVFPLATAVFLVGAKPEKIDFAGAMVLLSAALLLSFLGPMITSQLYEDQNVIPVAIFVLTAFIIAILLIAPAGNIAFDNAPRLRHKPLAPRRRSPLTVALVLLSAPILWLVVGVSIEVFRADLFEQAERPSAVLVVFLLIVLIATITAVIYFLYWIYRIHGELAGAQASQRLVTPLPALLITLLVPLGLPILLMTLGELLKDRAAQKGRERPLSIGWLALWSFCLPPVAMAMIQNAANQSYTQETLPK